MMLTVFWWLLILGISSSVATQPEALTGENFHEKVLESELPVLVYFWNEGCRTCRQVTPQVEEVVDSYAGDLVVYSVDNTKYKDIADQFEVKQVPTLQFFRDGEVEDEIVGPIPKYYNYFDDWLEELLSDCI